MPSKSFLDFAFDYMERQANPVSFNDLWNFVKEASDLSEEEAATKVSRFYTNLILDGRFVTLGENKWDLRTRHTFDKVHIDMKDIYNEVEVDDDDSEENEEEVEYNKAFEEESETPAGDDEAIAPETENVEEQETL